MAIFSVLLACARAPEGPWTNAAAMAPAIARLDADHDGKLTRDEYDAVAFGAGDFREWDRDDDGVLSVDEVEALWLAQDPIQFYPFPPSPPDRPLELPEPDLRGDVLVSLREEILAKQPDAAIPDEASLRAAAKAGGEAEHAALATLHAAAEKVGVGWPEGVGG